MLTLYHHGTSACAAKVRFALEEKRLIWESRYVDLMRGEQFAPDYLALNPKAVVPTLVHDGRVVPESTVICEYLDEAFPDRRIYPDDPWGRAEVRLWAKAVDEELHPACSALTYVVSHRHTIRRAGVGSFEDFLAAGGSEGRAARERKWHWIRQGLDAPGVADQLAIYVAFIRRMNDALDGRDWLVGDRLTMADIAMAPYVNRLAALALEPVWSGGRLPRVAAWFARIRARASFDAAFVRWLPEALAAEMRANGERAWPRIAGLLGIEALRARPWRGA
jgi:glutathione S-transferase